MTNNCLFAWSWRVIVLALIAVVMICGMEGMGLFDLIGGTASGFVGIVLGCLSLYGAFVWTGRS